MLYAPWTYLHNIERRRETTIGKMRWPTEKSTRRLSFFFVYLFIRFILYILLNKKTTNRIRTSPVKWCSCASMAIHATDLCAVHPIHAKPHGCRWNQFYIFLFLFSVLASTKKIRFGSFTLHVCGVRSFGFCSIEFFSLCFSLSFPFIQFQFMVFGVWVESQMRCVGSSTATDLVLSVMYAVDEKLSMSPMHLHAVIYRQ